MVGTRRFDTERRASLAPQGFSWATDVADWLVRRRVPFALAHEIAGAAVRYCETHGLELSDLNDAQLATISPHLDGAVRQVLSVEGSVAARSARGGTAPAAVRAQLGELRDALGA